MFALADKPDLKRPPCQARRLPLARQLALALLLAVGMLGGPSPVRAQEHHEGHPGEHHEGHPAGHHEQAWFFVPRTGWRYEVRPGFWSPYYAWWWIDGRVVLQPVPAVPVVQYPSGRYELRGDGVAVPYYWLWVPASMPPPPPVPAPVVLPAPPTPPPPPPMAQPPVAPAPPGMPQPPPPPMAMPPAGPPPPPPSH